MQAAEIGDAETLRRFLTARFGAVPGEGEGALHVAAVWRAPGADRQVVLRIGPETPKSELDFLLLNVARARADAIVTTGRILREEPEVVHDLQGSGAIPRALLAWRASLGLGPPPWLLVLTGGRDLDPDHPAFHSWARPLLFCPASSADAVRRRFAGSRVVTAGHPEPDLRRALDHLARDRGARRISIEAGPSTAGEAYRHPVAVHEVLLSVLVADTIAAELQGGELPGRSAMEDLLGPPASRFETREPSGRWRFERYLRRGATCSS